MGSSSHFMAEDKLHEKSDYHEWKMSLDLTLEEQEVLDNVKGKILGPPSNAPAATKNKYTKGEVKVKMIIRDSIDKRLVAYISDLNTSKEINDRLVSMFKVCDANQVFFLKNMLKDIKKGKDEDIQSYFLRITKIKNDLLSIGEVIPNRELTITNLGGLPSEWYIFRTTLLNNDRILRFEELMSRCIQEETRMVEQEMPSNRGNPSAFSSHAKRRNNSGSKGHFNGKPRSKGGRKGRCFVCNKFGHHTKECPNRKDTSHDDDHNHSRGNFNNNNQRNGRFNGKGKKECGKSWKWSTLQESKELQGNAIHLQEVLYVPDLKKNLVSILAMEYKSYKVAFIDGKVHVWKKNFEGAFTLGFRVDSLYQVGGSPLGAMSCDTSLQSELWHRRFAHLHYKALPDVRQMVTGMPEFKVEH
eukprot:PITA_30004